MITVWAPDGVGEVGEGDDLAEILLAAVHAAPETTALRDGDIVAVTSKVVSKAEGRARASTREQELPGETVRVVARRGHVRIVRNRLGLTMAAAGIDASNVAAGTVLLLPERPDESARRIRAAIATAAGVNVAVVVTDTAGRAWREGQTDIAIGAAGLRVLDSFAGRTDAYGNQLAVTAPAVADEIASAAELAQGKLGARPFAVLRGRGDLVLPAGEDGPGAGALVRGEGADFFGYGAREAVVRALAGDVADRRPFGAPAAAADLAEAIATVTGLAVEVAQDEVRVPAGEADVLAKLTTLAFAFGWELSKDPDRLLRLRPVTP
ncbi:coenzyme F420-0:L-glutamate ligase [Nocardioides sp.]|uniref:coenzyme F420-0:L-glutamate ligase n=1 Tax=Nocardioides sp. TaxID=35761 RepID=UPI0039E570B3